MSKAVAPEITQRIRAEYLAMPGLSLRAEQVRRLCGVDTAVCESLLEALVESGFLTKRSDGAYGRERNPDMARARQAKATLESRAGATATHARPRAS